MNELRKNLPPLPENMKDLPISAKGWPVPAFVARPKYGEEWDLRVISPKFIRDCIHDQLCWCCGKSMGNMAVFVGGPMMALNHASAEPPSHPECAVFAVQACPFMLHPKAQRREGFDTDTHTDYSPGNMLVDNPGVSVLYYTESYEAMQSGNGYMFLGGDPTRMDWYSEGKLTTRERAQDALNKRVDDLINLYPNMDREEVRDLAQMKDSAEDWLPRE